jgi:hypothetical protein
MLPPIYLDHLMSALDGAFGNSLNAAYISGSAAVGAYQAGTSDLDVLVAVDVAERSALDRIVATCSHEALPCPATKLELVVYEAAALASPGRRPRWSLNFDTGAGVHHVGFDPDAEPAHWFVLDLAFARRHAGPLLGPPPATLIGEVSDDAIEQALEQMVRWYELNEPAGVDVARQRARHWRLTGNFAPKPGLPSP